MKNTIQILSILGAAALFTLPVSAGGPPHHNEGVGLATDIVRLVKTILDTRQDSLAGSPAAVRNDDEGGYVRGAAYYAREGER